MDYQEKPAFSSDEEGGKQGTNRRRPAKAKGGEKPAEKGQPTK